MSFFRGFCCAARGIACAVRERNFRFHLCAATAVIYFGLRFYSFGRAEWAALLLTCSGVISLEAVNTSVERLCDKVCPEKDELIRKCKDISAGAVLISAVFSVIIGAVMFWDTDKFSEIIAYFSEPLRLTALIIAVIIAVTFVFLPEKYRRK